MAKGKVHVESPIKLDHLSIMTGHTRHIRLLSHTNASYDKRKWLYKPTAKAMAKGLEYGGLGSTMGMGFIIHMGSTMGM